MTNNLWKGYSFRCPVLCVRTQDIRTVITQIYRVIRKSLCTWWLQYGKLQVMFKVSAASLQTFIDKPNCVLEDRVQYSTVTVGDWNCLKYFIFRCFLYCNRQVHREILITLYKQTGSKEKDRQGLFLTHLNMHVTFMTHSSHPPILPKFIKFHF